MTRAEAHRRLDAARVGEAVSVAQITEALRVTGDLVDDEAVQVLRPAGSWERPRAPALLAPAGPFDGLAA